MIWLVLTLTMISAVVPQWWSEWGFRIWVMASLGANVALGLLSGTRRRSASGWRAIGRMVVVWILWGSYQLAEKATTSAISGLTLGDSDVSEDEKQVVALWAAFLLLYLGGPDNLSAYSLEDNKLSKRTWLEMMGNISGVGYAIYKYTYGGGHSRFLFAASVIISVVGANRYIERAYALSKANLDKMQEDASSASPGNSSKKKREECHRCRSAEFRMGQLRDRIERKRQWKLSDGEALFLAQDLFPVWRHAMVDASVIPGSRSQLASEQILWLEWRSMCNVAEMELSLMYEVLYTKAIVAHSCPVWYYLVRFLSPLCTAAAALLFWLHRQQAEQGGQGIRGSFDGITYALLLINFLLDLAWLLRALGSTWAYAYMETQAPAWLRHQVICPGRWRCLHRFVVRVDPMRWLLRRDPISYRTWSGTIGRYNLLREATTTTSTCCPEWLVPKEMRYLSKLRPEVKGLLFQRVQKILRQAISKKKLEDPADYSKKNYIMDDIRAKWGQKAFDLRKHNLTTSDPDRKRVELFPQVDDDEAPKFGKVFEEDVIVWYIATCIVLQYIRRHLQRRGDFGGPLSAARSKAHATAIEVMSDYLMFLVAVRRDMLPGLVLHSLFKITKETLVSIWGNRDKLERAGDNRKAINNEEMLALLLRRAKRDGNEESSIKIEGGEGDTPDDRARRKNAINSGQTARRGTPVPVPELLEFIFNVWVDKLVYAAIQCSRESHAKQLSAGGDLTTVLWMVIQHAGLFRMGELKPIYFRIPRPAGPPASRPVLDAPWPPPQAKPPPPPPDKKEELKKEEPKPPKKEEPKPPPPKPELPPPPVKEEPPPPKAPPPPPPQPDKDEDSDDEDTEEYNKPINYVTLNGSSHGLVHGKE
ncbi:hypothetical protein EJB05_33317, partial [Eragrostis curvula]